MAMFGADEAGRGPVLGPMVAAAVRADPETLPPGVADSKALTSDERDDLAAAMRSDDRITVGVSVVSPDRIDDPATDMNALTVVAQAEAITQVLGVAVDRDRDPATNDEADQAVERKVPRGVVDACDVDPERFARRVRGALPVTVDLCGEHRADESHAIVAAASVVAKVERDALVAEVGEAYCEYGPVGSGYPSDPRTREFLRTYVRANGELPTCARASWKTSRDVLRAAEQSALGEF